MITTTKDLKFNPLPKDKLLDESDLKDIRSEAKEFVFKEDKKKARARALDEMIREERAKVDPGEELISFPIDLPPYAPDITLDGRVFLHGQTYKFTRHQLNSIREIAQQAWRNESKIIRTTNSKNRFGDKLGVTLSGSMY